MASSGGVGLESVIVALISGGMTLAGVLASNSKSRAVMEQKIDELSHRVDKHNCLVERTYCLERDVALLRNDVESLERKAEQHERVPDRQ
jgi:outer membrane murein-binding lipoprotein Lpp